MESGKACALESGKACALESGKACALESGKACMCNGVRESLCNGVRESLCNGVREGLCNGDKIRRPAVCKHARDNYEHEDCMVICLISYNYQNHQDLHLVNLQEAVCSCVHVPHKLHLVVFLHFCNQS